MGRRRKGRLDSLTLERVKSRDGGDDSLEVTSHPAANIRARLLFERASLSPSGRYCDGVVRWLLEGEEGRLPLSV